MFRIVPQRVAEVQNMAFEDFRLHEGLGPQSFQQLILGHQPPGTLHQVPEHGKCRGRQANPLVVSTVLMTPETFVDCVQPERRELLRASAYNAMAGCAHGVGPFVLVTHCRTNSALRKAHNESCADYIGTAERLS